MNAEYLASLDNFEYGDSDADFNSDNDDCDWGDFEEQPVVPLKSAPVVNENLERVREMKREREEDEEKREVLEVDENLEVVLEVLENMENMGNYDEDLLLDMVHEIKENGNYGDNDRKSDGGDYGDDDYYDHEDDYGYDSREHVLDRKALAKSNKSRLLNTDEFDALVYELGKWTESNNHDISTICSIIFEYGCLECNECGITHVGQKHKHCECGFFMCYSCFFDTRSRCRIVHVDEEDATDKCRACRKWICEECEANGKCVLCK